MTALVGALAEDQTPKRAQNFVLDFILTYLVDKDLMEIWEIPNPRFHMKNILKREGLPAPEYRLLGQSGVGTIEACFVVGIYCNKELIGFGQSFSYFCSNILKRIILRAGRDN